MLVQEPQAVSVSQWWLDVTLHALQFISKKKYKLASIAQMLTEAVVAIISGRSRQD